MRLTRVSLDSLHYDFTKRYVRNMRRLMVFWTILSIWNFVWVLENLFTDGSGMYLMFYVFMFVVSLLGGVMAANGITRAIDDDIELHTADRLATVMERHYNEARNYGENNA